MTNLVLSLTFLCPVSYCFSNTSTYLKAQASGARIVLDFKRVELSQKHIKNIHAEEMIDQIDFSLSSLNDSHLRQIVNANKRIRCLRLGFTNITDIGIKILSKMKALEEVDLEYTGVTEEALKDLIQLKR